MPEKLVGLLAQDVNNIPMALGMVVKAKNFIIDKPLMAFIGMLMIASSSTGVAIYKLSLAEKVISKQSLQIEAMILAVNTLTVDIAWMRRDLDKITTSLDRHLEGHPVKIRK